MAQLRRDHPQFQALNTQVLVLLPNGPRLIARYVNATATPYPILSDKGARVTRTYGIRTRRAVVFDLFTPTVFLVDQSGLIRYTNYQRSYIKEPDNREPLAVLARLSGSAHPPSPLTGG